MRLALIFTFTLWSMSAAALTRDAEPFAKNGVFIELEAKSFELTSRLVRELYLQDVENESLDDEHWDGPLGVKVDAKGLTYSVAFDAFRVYPSEDALVAEVTIRSVKVHAAKIEIDPPLLPLTKCRNASIHLAEDEPIKVKLAVGLEVKDESFVAQAGELDFSLSEENYRSHGPEECSGNFLTRRVKRFIIERLLSRGRKLVEREIRKSIHKSVPGVADILNVLVKQQLEFTLNEMPPLVKKTIYLDLSPNKINLVDERMRLYLNIDVSDQPQLPEVKDNLKFASALGMKYLLGKAGIHTVLINELLATILNGASEYVELTEDVSPELKKILSRQHLSALWPDLNELELDTENLRLFVKLAAAPELYIPEGVSANAGLRLKVNNLSIKTMIKRGGSWQDYFLMDLSVDAAAKLSVANEYLEIGLGENNTYTLNGAWAENYKPSIPIFEVEIAEILINSVFDILYASSPVLRTKLPEIELYEQSMHVNQIELLDGYISVDIWAVGE